MNKFCGAQVSGIERAKLEKMILPEVQYLNATPSRGPLGIDTRKTSETYRGELFRLGRYRVAVCREGLQWLYQKRRLKFKAVGAAWDTLGYCVSRNSLMRLHRAHNGTDTWAISALPSHINRGSAK